MNERLKQLMGQCYETGPIGRDGWPEYSNLNGEKFAQLIVRECMDIARKVGNISEPDDFALDRCYEIEQRIQDRFGVEE